MFHASFQAYCPIRDKSEEEIRVSLDDAAIQRVLRALDEGRSDVRVSVQRSPQAGDSNLVLEWDAECAGFLVRADGRSAGFVPFDELRGALDKPLSKGDVPVQVCLRGEVDVWRRGVFSPESGRVIVYTATPGLGFLGMEAFVIRGEGRADSFVLNGGDPARVPMHVPSREMKGIARAEPVKLGTDRLGSLGGLVPRLEPFA